MRSRHMARLWCAAVAGLALLSGGLAGPASAALAGSGAGPAGTIPGGTISTIAGGVGGPGLGRSVAVFPCGLKTALSSLYIGTGSEVHRENILTGELTTVVGNNAAGPTGDGGVATQTATGACGTAADPAGDLAIADGQVVKLIPARTGSFYGQKMTAGHIYTAAGNLATQRSYGIASCGCFIPSGDGGPAIQASLGTAGDLAFDRAGNLLIADTGQPFGFDGCGDDCPALSGLLRVVAASTGTFYGIKMTAGDIYSIAGVEGPVNARPHSRPYAKGDSGPASGSWLGPWLYSAEPDRAGNIILAGQDEPVFIPGQQIVVAPYVQVIAEATGTYYGQKMTAGDIYQVAGNGTNAGPFRNAVPGTKTSLWSGSDAIADFSGNVLIGDNGEVRVVAVRSGRFYGQNMKAGYIYRIAGFPTAGYSGDGGPAIRALLTVGPIGLDGFGNVLLGGGARVRVIAARTGRFYGQNMKAGDIYTVAGNGSADSGDGGPPLAAGFTSPGGISVSTAGDIAFNASAAVDVIPARSRTLFGRKMTAGKLYIVAGEGIHSATFSFQGDAPVAFDASGNLVVAYANSADVRLVPATSGTFYGQKMTADGVYDIAGTSTTGFSGDGGPALKAKLSAPDGAVVDQHGNVLIDDSGNNRVRVLAARTGTFYGRAMKAGDIYTIAGNGTASYSGDGGPATAAGVQPTAVAVDAAGNLLVTDASQRVRVVAAGTGSFYGQAMTAGNIYTIAGNGTAGFSGSGGPATVAEFSNVGGLTVDRHGNVLVSDNGNNVVWAVAAATGKFYGQAMTVGDIYVVAGGGTAILGDGGPATRAKIGDLAGVAVSATGSLLVADGADNRLRAITVAGFPSGRLRG